MSERAGKALNTVMIVNIVVDIATFGYMVAVVDYTNAFRWLIITLFNLGLFMFVKQVEKKFASLIESGENLESAIKRTKNLMEK